MEKKSFLMILFFLTMTLLFESGKSFAGELNNELNNYVLSLKQQAKSQNPDFEDFSAKRGENLYLKEFPNPENPLTRSCATCHTKDTRAKGAHNVSGKTIEPLAPAANPERLTSLKKVKKWFRRNCKWVKQGECSAQEKGDFIAYLLSL